MTNNVGYIIFMKNSLTMSNEEYVEELLYNVHKSGVFNKFIDKVNRMSIKNPNLPLNEVREKIYYKMVKKGSIKV